MATKKNSYTIDTKAWLQSNYVFTVEMSADQKKKVYDQVLLDYQKDASEPGFRKWHVPLHLVEKKINQGTLFMWVLEHHVNNCIQQILEEHGDKKWIGQIYNLDTKDYGDQENNGTIVFTLDVFPEVKEKDKKRKNHTAKWFDPVVSDEDIQTALNQLRSSYAGFDDVPEVTATSLMRLKITFLDKDAKEIGKSKNQYLGEEELAEHPTLHKAFIGKKKHDVVELDYKKASVIFLLQYKWSEEVSRVQCEIIDIKQKVLPELDQAFIDKVFPQEDSINSVDELKQQVQETLSKTKIEDSLYQWIDEYLVAINNSFEVQVPQTLTEEETNNRLQQLGQQLGGEQWLKMYLERMGEEESKKYIETIKQSSISSIHKYFILKFVAQELELDIDRTKAQERWEVEKKLYEKLTEKSKK